MDELEALERAAGLDPDSSEYRLRELLAKADDELLEQLVQIRIYKQLTQQTVADRMKRDKAAVSNFERLGTDPHLSTIRRYAAAVGATVTHRVRDFDAAEAYNFQESAVGVAFSELLDAFLAQPDEALDPFVEIWDHSEPGTVAGNVIDMGDRRARRGGRKQQATAIPACR